MTRSGAVAAVILDSLAEGVVTVDTRGRIAAFNRAAEKLTGLRRADVVGRACDEVFGPCCGGVCVVTETLRTGQPLRDRRANLRHRNGRLTPVAVTTNLLTDDEGRSHGAVATIRDVGTEETLRRELKGRLTVQDMVSRSPRMRELFDLLPAVAASPSTVLISGESGTGKELLARAVHALSPRAKGPFVAINCGALPDNLLEAELFGVKKGAYTDARADRPGRFARAKGGTLFLDEIGEVSAAMQVRLLRVLQEKAYEPLGATAPEPADVRVVAATNRDLQAEVAAGRFRLDLFYRLNVVALRLPPLRERPEDIALLAEHFVDRQNALQGRRVPGLSDEALAVLGAHAWPGNVRELENAIEHAFVRCGGGLIEPMHLPEAVRKTPAAAPASATPPAADPLADAEREALRAVLARHGGNRRAAAQELGLHRVTLYRKLKQHGLG